MDLFRCLRPSLQTGFRGKPCAAYGRFFAASTKLLKDKPPKARRDGPQSDFDKRLQLLETHQGRSSHWYPRLQSTNTKEGRPEHVRKAASGLEPGQSITRTPLVLRGRVKSVRAASSKLLFLDVERRSQTVQVVCNLGSMHGDVAPDDAKHAFRKTVRRGDWVSVTGYPHKSPSGEPGFLASALPLIKSPSLHQIPTVLEDAETKARKPHVSMLVDPTELQTIFMRSKIEQHVFTYLADRGFNNVRTPILTAGAGGAIAKPFETVATELSDMPLNLRIAPELWLKRLILGGADKVFELGPAFRNEGVDNTHNPEFTMCEFYSTFTSIETLMSWTEELLHDLFNTMAKFKTDQISHLPSSIVYRAFDGTRLEPFFPEKFERLPFIPTLEREMGRSLPDLSASSAHGELTNLFATLGLPLPSHATVPTLLDALASQFLEPLCVQPTFITEHPAAVSPLAKSYTCPTTRQLISARAELFIEAREYANMYEEENSPFEQRRKFEEQLAFRRQLNPDTEAEIDESYLEALEWGLPPTGGWGMGIDRLVMLFTGRKRIGDVLPFGTLRNVVGMRGRWRE
ncbi:Lysine--tRNA ligase-like protein [Elsinoe fawcettii]|nr:Lysine--tRNA ligase-like protein [Elsinoe fawcettii]